MNLGTELGFLKSKTYGEVSQPVEHTLKDTE